MSAWIDVKDKRPPFDLLDECVLVTDGTHVGVGAYYNPSRSEPHPTRWHDISGWPIEVTHWAPLPDPPAATVEEPEDHPGRKLKQFRIEVLRMGLRSFCKWLGVRPSHVSNVERGRAFDAPPDDIEQLIRDGKFYPVCPEAARKMAAKILQEKPDYHQQLKDLVGVDEPTSDGKESV